MARWKQKTQSVLKLWPCTAQAKLWTVSFGFFTVQKITQMQLTQQPGRRIVCSGGRTSGGWPGQSSGRVWCLLRHWNNRALLEVQGESSTWKRDCKTKTCVYVCMYVCVCVCGQDKKRPKPNQLGLSSTRVWTTHILHHLVGAHYCICCRHRHCATGHRRWGVLVECSYLHSLALVFGWKYGFFLKNVFKNNFFKQYVECGVCWLSVAICLVWR